MYYTQLYCFYRRYNVMNHDLRYVSYSGILESVQNVKCHKLFIARNSLHYGLWFSYHSISKRLLLCLQFQKRNINHPICFSYRCIVSCHIFSCAFCGTLVRILDIESANYLELSFRQKHLYMFYWVRSLFCNSVLCSVTDGQNAII